MNKLNIELTNCFGIDSLKHEFDFGKGNTFSIYARNGLMKTSFAKTFQLIQQGKKENISDAIFGEPGSAIVQIDGQDIEKKQVFVVKSYESSYESDISSLLIKGDIQTQLKDVFKVRTKLLKALEKDSGLKIKRTSLGKTVYELEPTIVKDFDFNEKDILSNLMELASYEPEIECSDIPYSVIFDDTVLKKIKDTKFQEGIRDFITSSDEIYSSFEYLEKGNLTLPKLKDLKKSLVKDAFFVKQNKVILPGLHTLNAPLACEYSSATELRNSDQLGLKYADSLKALLDLETKYTTSKDDLSKLNAVDYSSEIGGGLAIERVAVVQQGNWIGPELSGIDEEVANKMGILPIPLKGVKEDCIPTGISIYWCINSQSGDKEKEASKEFLKWLFQSDEGKQIVVNDFGFVPAFNNYDDVEITDTLSKEVKRYIDEGKTLPWVMGGFPSGYEPKAAADFQGYFSGEYTFDQMVDQLKADFVELKK